MLHSQKIALSDSQKLTMLHIPLLWQIFPMFVLFDPPSFHHFFLSFSHLCLGMQNNLYKAIEKEIKLTTKSETTFKLPTY